MWPPAVPPPSVKKTVVGLMSMPTPWPLGVLPMTIPVQCPPEHEPPLHECPHAPQLSGSEVMSTHELLAMQYVGLADGHPHVPLLQTNGADAAQFAQVAPQ
jgi:hypothetical protein